MPEQPAPQLPELAGASDGEVVTLTRAELNAREARAYAAGWRDAITAGRRPQGS